MTYAVNTSIHPGGIFNIRQFDGMPTLLGKTVMPALSPEAAFNWEKHTYTVLKYKYKLFAK